MQKDAGIKAEIELQRASWMWDISRGDESSFTALYDSTVDLIYGLALRIVAVPAIAEEAVEATYFYAWQNAARFDHSRAGVLTWLMVICRSQSLMLLRACNDQAATCVDGALYEEVSSHSDDPHLLIVAIEEHTALHAAIKHLCARDRQILALAFFRGLTYAEVGVHLDMPVGTVKTRVRYAIDILRDQLKNLRCNHAER